MKITKIESSRIVLHDVSEVKLKTSGKSSLVQFLAGQNTECQIQNLNKEEYLDKSTGEIRQKKHKDSRFQSPKRVRRSIHTLMDLIRCNAKEASHCKWITLTYRDVMTDHEHVYEDAKMFLRRLQRHLKKQPELSDAQKSFQRITVAEPQGEGHGNSWHLHILLIYKDTAPYIENDVIADIWENGITKTQKVYDADGLALYFKVCLNDMEYTDDSNISNRKIVDKTVDGVSKKFMKGERLKYYPTGMQLFTSSRGMDRPHMHELKQILL